MFEQTKAELAAAAAADVTLSPTGLIADEMRELREIELKSVAQRLRRLDVFDQRDGCIDDGQVTSTAWSRTELGLTHGQASTEVSVARVRRTCPHLAGTFDAGRTSFRHLQITAVAMGRLHEPEIWAGLDDTLTGWAQETPARQYAEMLDVLVTQLTPEPKPKDQAQHEKRRLQLSGGFDGMVNVSGRLTPEVGEKLHAALSAASRPDVDGENRSTGQRKADALDHLLDTVLDTALLPVDGGEKPHINVLVPLDDLTDENLDDATEGATSAGPATSPWPAAVDAQRTAAAEAAAEALDRRPRFSWTGPTSRNTVRRLSCDGILLPIFTRRGQPLDVGRRTRVVSAPLRAYIVARDRHCQWPGCTMPTRWTDVHHVHHWRDGGTTDRTNLILLCNEHHRAAHSGTFVVVLHTPGTITIRPRKAGEAYYDIRPDPPRDQPGPQPPLIDLLTTAARHLKSA